jgi:hypothetical protein
MEFSVTQNGKVLDKSKYSWDEKTRTFSTNENSLVIDFGNNNGITFNTGSDCTFNTGSDCTFNTGYNCTFKTGYNCTFKTGYNCTFKTGDNCVCIRYDVKGVIEIPENKTIKLNGYGVSGFTFVEEVKEVSCNGKIVEIDGKKYQLKEIA